MPFTPLHMGPALALKPFLGARFSLIAFGLAQIVIDLEQLVRRFLPIHHEHGPSHTFLAALAIGVLTGFLLLKPARFLLKLYRSALDKLSMMWLDDGAELSAKVMMQSAVLGTLTHVLFDAIVHADVVPFAPFWPGNPLLWQGGWGAFHDFCYASGALGAVAYVLLRAWGQRSR